jgi:hypothetical protein
MNPDSSNTSNRLLVMRLCAIFAVALVVRLIGLWILFPEDGWKTVGYGSELGQIAANLAGGRGFSSPFENGSQPSAWLSPLVPFVWSIVFRIFGEFSAGSLMCIGVLQCVMSAAACVLYFRISSHLSKQAGYAGLRWPLILALIVILWPMCIRAAVTFWYYAWQEVATAGLFLAAMSWLDQGTPKRALKLGLCAGIVAYINPVPIVILIGACIMALRQDRVFRQRRLVQIALAGLVIVIMVSPWMLRNGIVLKAFVPMRSSFGVELLQGNNPEGAIVQSRNSLHPALNMTERTRFKKSGEIGYCHWALGSALHYMQTSEGATFQRIVLRIYVFWFSDLRGDWTWMEQTQWWHAGFRAIVKALSKIGIWVFPLAISIIVWMRFGLNKVPRKGLLITLLLCLPLPYYLTHVSPLYAYGIHPYLLIFAIVGIAVHEVNGQAVKGPG